MASSSSSTQQNSKPDAESKATEKDISWYLPLYNAAMTGDWEKAKKFLAQDKDAVTANIAEAKETALIMAVGTGNAIDFVEKLVELTPSEGLVVQDSYKNTALTIAAMVGNTKAAVILVNKNPALLQIPNAVGAFPVHKAAVNSYKETLLYLLSEAKTKYPLDPKPFEGEYGVQLLIHTIVSGFIDIALSLVHDFPSMATLKLKKNGDCALKAIARKASAFPSGSHLNFWQRAIYAFVSVNLENSPCKNSNKGDIENGADKSGKSPRMCSLVRLLGGSYFISVCQKLHVALQEIIELVPSVRHIREEKMMHHQALELVERLCKEIKSLNHSSYRSHYREAILEAARLGIHEVVEKILETFPDAIVSQTADRRFIFHVAVTERSENVFNLIYHMTEHKTNAHIKDNSGNTILHMAAKLAPPHKLDLVSGAALQMQRELQWFKEVEKFVNPAFREIQNNDKETPAMVFSKQHKTLVIEGEKWMKDTANSCIVTAALIATVVFAAALTVPGGNKDDGKPIFSKETAFTIFAVADAISLFTSTASVLLFLSILTSRYAEKDFLYILPKRLIIGLITMFLSITSMMIAFTATLYLVFGKENPWIIVPVVASACLPVTLFVSLQFPLLVDAVSSTYGTGIFGKQRNRPFYTHHRTS